MSEPSTDAVELNAAERDRRAMERLQVDFWRKEREQSFAYVGDQSKWLVTQLLVANSGALFAVLKADMQPSALLPGGLFVLGALLAFTCGFATYGAGIAGLIETEPLTRADRIFDPAAAARDMGAKEKAANAWLHRLIKVAMLAGILSAVCFGVGAMTVAMNPS